MNRLAAALLLFILPAYGVWAGSLGRLFFTPEQRAQLELKVMQEVVADEAGSTPILNGIVQKNGGPRTAWINGVPQNSDGSKGRAPDSETISTPGKPFPAILKVGQRYLPEPESGRQ